MIDCYDALEGKACWQANATNNFFVVKDNHDLWMGTIIMVAVSWCWTSISSEWTYCVFQFHSTRAELQFKHVMRTCLPCESYPGAVLLWWWWMVMNGDEWWWVVGGIHAQDSRGVKGKCSSWSVEIFIYRGFGRVWGLWCFVAIDAINFALVRCSATAGVLNEWLIKKSTSVLEAAGRKNVPQNIKTFWPFCIEVRDVLL